MANIKYKLCPNCELNWIPEDQDICDVCKQAYKGNDDYFDELTEEELMLCPICNINYILESEDMCESCAAERVKDEEKDDEGEYDFSEDVAIADDEEDIIVSFDEIEEEEEEFAKDEEIYDDIDDDDQDY